DPSTGAYISQDPIGLAGGSRLYGYVHDSNTWVDESGLYGVKHDTPAWNARKNQKSTGYNPDSWRTGSLKKGTEVYGGVPGQSPYYTDKATLKASGNNKVKLWKSLQVNPHPTLGYRTEIQKYVVKRDINVGKGYALANGEVGGGRQFFIEDYKDVLEPVGEPIKLNDGKSIKLCK
ncbi:MAG: type IV secretion protein Rhs, partial [Bacteroidota bacterium]|nr:type IV secretion protein Rhs [Bacteroidota bacterium]